ncbi:hypothetical protein [uncultured Mucilaginibacter sp.]|uniref:hypothetical protein n=1 Tax=uncultured Mucilaginibacter sp. TaxID=797541 RepID=UPI0025F1B37C|nr:hypothetical protein [uncultured Mucilaginibacter sp.]
MKKSYTNRLLIKVFGLLLLIITAFIVNSCRKNNSVSPETNIGNDIDLAALQKIYTNDSVPGNVLVTDKSTLIQTRDVIWGKIYFLQRAKSRVLEFDINKDNNLWTLGAAPSLTKNKTSAVFLEFNDGSRLNFYMKVIENLQDSTSSSVIPYVHYNNIPANFSGQVMFYTLNRQFINGYNYVNGKIKGYYTPNKSTTSGNGNIQSINPKLATLIYETDCFVGYTYGYNIDDNGVYHVSPLRDVTVTCYSFSYDDGTGDDNTNNGPVTGDPSTGGDPGDGNTQPPPCNPPVPTDTTTTNTTPPSTSPYPNVIHGHAVVQSLAGCPPADATPPPPVGFRPLCKSSIVLTFSSSNSSEVNLTGVQFGITDLPHFPFYQTQTNVIVFNLYISIPNNIIDPTNPSNLVTITPSMQKEFIYQAYHYASAQINLIHGQDFFLAGAQPVYSSLYATLVMFYLNNIALQGMFPAFENANPGLIPSLGARASTLINPLKATPAVYTTAASGEGC